MPSNRPRTKSSISQQINAIPSSSKASLEVVRERSIERHPPEIRRIPDPNNKDPFTPLDNPDTELKNPVKDPNWPDEAFTKTAPEARHLASEVQDQIEKWTCVNVECRRSNEKHLKKCEGCGWELPVVYHKDKLGQKWNEEKVLRRFGDGVDGANTMTREGKPTGPAPGGAMYIPWRPGQKKKIRVPNIFSEDGL
jgi:hypothetical protein